jgi:hypothetical protein
LEIQSPLANAPIVPGVLKRACATFLACNASSLGNIAGYVPQETAGERSILEHPTTEFRPWLIIPVMIADEGQLPPMPVVQGRRPVAFPSRDGWYAGPHANDAQALDLLCQARASGARFLVLAWPAFRWLTREVTDRFR